MKYTIDKVENGYIIVKGEKPDVYVFTKRHRVIDWLDSDLQ